MTGLAYSVLMVDPPWPKKKGGLRTVRPKQTRLLNYSTMSIPAIFTLLDAQIFPRAAPTHCVFLWMIEQFLAEAEAQMLLRGYKRHARIVWDKGNGMAPAFTVRYTHEYLGWFYKPTLPPIAQNMRGKLTTVWSEAQREHSRKPDVAYSNVERLYPDVSRLDVFSRENRIGWDSWGDQCGHFDD